MILYTENPKDTTRKLLNVINEYSQVAGYKINMQKSFAFLYTNNEKTEREIKETITFTIAMRWIKYLGINLLKETKDLYIEKCKTLIKEIKMTQIYGEIYHVHGSEKSVYWKWVYSPKQSIDSMQSISSYQWYFSELEQIISQFV